MKREFIKTEDGSHTLYVGELKEHYHSTHGAIQESKHVFINAGFKYIRTELPAREPAVLEIGFGTGLNALLTLMDAELDSSMVNYTALEAFPVETELAKELNYVELLSGQNPELKNNLRVIFDQLHNSEWNKKIPVTEYFTFKKINDKLQHAAFEKESFDLIYFDAFGPQAQPEMWTEEVLQKIFDATTAGGALVTYCAKGEVKRTLKKVGFIVDSIPGPPGKREMTRARK